MRNPAERNRRIEGIGGRCGKFDRLKIAPPNFPFGETGVKIQIQIGSSSHVGALTTRILTNRMCGGIGLSFMYRVLLDLHTFLIQQSL